MISEARGNKLGPQRFDRVRGEQPIARRRDHHGIEHDVPRRPSRQPCSNGVDHGRLRHHPDLDGLDVEIAEHRVDLRGHELGGTG